MVRYEEIRGVKENELSLVNGAPYRVVANVYSGKSLHVGLYFKDDESINLYFNGTQMEDGKIEYTFDDASFRRVIQEVISKE